MITTNTFHSFAKNIVEENYIKLGYTAQPILIDKDELVHLLLKNLKKIKYFNSKTYNRSPVQGLKSILSIHDQFHQELFSEIDFNNIKRVTTIYI